MVQSKVRDGSDMELRRNVISELNFEPAINAAHIGVGAEDGVVTLSGHVESYVEKLAAEKAAKRVKGVKALAEEIKVRFPEDKKTADDEIANRAIRMLEWNGTVPFDSVMVKVQDGWVHLSGEVNWKYQCTAVESLIHRLSGIKGIINHIVVRPHVEPLDVKCKIEDALNRSAQALARGISVSVEDSGHVVLEGQVNDWQARNAVEDAAWSAPGVTWVDNRLDFD
jgi:osmotically-inducible protein OsmY